jgi:hypothetical protein
MMNCTLCDELLELGQAVTRIAASTVEWGGAEFPMPVLIPSMFEDGSREKIVHTRCLLLSGAPLSLAGADPNWRQDV